MGLHRIFGRHRLRTGHEVILKVTQPAMDSLKLQILWTRCQNAVPIPLSS